jgi:hypothetical protein
MEHLAQKVPAVGVGLSLKGIDDFEKGKTVKVGIPSANLPDAVLTHEDSCVRVVEYCLLGEEFQ